MSLEEKERERAESGWKPKPGDNLPVTIEEFLSGIKETAHAMDEILRGS